MGRVIYGVGINSFRGKIGGVSFGANASGEFCRQVGFIRNRYSVRRLNSFPALVDLRQEWYNIGAENRPYWESFAAAHTWIDPWGIEKKNNGFAWFVAINTNRQNLSQPILTMPPTWNPPPATPDSYLLFESDEWKIAHTTNNADPDIFFKLQITPPLTIGQVYYKSQLRTIDILASRDAGYYSIDSLLGNYFGFSYPSPYDGETLLFGVGLYTINIRKSTGLWNSGHAYLFPNP